MISFHHPSLGEPQQASAAHVLVVTQTRDLLLQACGPGSTHDPDPFSRIQQSEVTPRKRGRPQQIGWTQLWCSLLIGTLQGMHSFADWRRLLGLRVNWPLRRCAGSHAMGWSNDCSRRACVLYQNSGKMSMHNLLTSVRRQSPQRWRALRRLFSAWMRTRLDAVGRDLKPLRGLSANNGACGCWANWWASLICAHSDGFA